MVYLRKLKMVYACIRKDIKGDVTQNLWNSSIVHLGPANIDGNLWLKSVIWFFISSSFTFVYATIYFMSTRKVGHCQRKLFLFRHAPNIWLSIWTPLPMVINNDFHSDEQRYTVRFILHIVWRVKRHNVRKSRTTPFVNAHLEYRVMICKLTSVWNERL